MSAYTKTRAIEQVWYLVTGGKADPDSDVLKADIYSYLPAAINAAIGNDLKERKLLAIRERKPSNFKLNDILLIQTFTPQYDEARKLLKIDLPFFIPSYSGEIPINILPQDGGNPYVFFETRAKTQGIELILGDTAYAWLERTITGQTLYFKNVLCDTCPILIEAACDYDNIGDDVVLPVPDNLWERIFDSCVQYFTKQRFIPSNDTINGNDENKG